MRSAFRLLLSYIALAIAYVALAVAHTYPLVRNLDTHLAGQGLADNVSMVWNIWWMREALASPDRSFFTCPLIVAPLGGSLILHTHTALAAFAGATLLAPFPLIEAQNLILIASLALNGIAAYALSCQVSGERWPSAIAGAFFVVAPAITVRLMGHYNLVMVWPLLFACAAFVRWWKAPRVWTALVLGVTAALVPYTDYYFAVFLLLFVAVYTATELWSADVAVERRPHAALSLWIASLALLAFIAALAIVLSSNSEVQIGPARISVRTPTNALTFAWLLTVAAILARWRFRVAMTRRIGTLATHIPSAVTALIVCAVLLSPLVPPAWQLWRSGQYVTQASALRSSPTGVDLATIFMGPPYAGAAGARVRDVYSNIGIDVIESSAWLGVGTLLLLVIAFGKRTWSAEERRWMGIGAFFGVWSLGPYLMALGVNTGLLLPQALARVVPLVNNARIPGRAMVMVAMSVSVLASFALLRVAAARNRGAWIISAIAIVVAVESLAAPLPLVRVPDPGVYRELRAGVDGAVLTLPFGVRDGFGEKGFVEHDALFGQTVHGHALAGGFLARLPPGTWAWYERTEPFRTLLALSGGEPVPTVPATCASTAAGLKAASVSHVVVYKHDISDALGEFVRNRMPLRPLSEDPDRILFSVTACPE